MRRMSYPVPRITDILERPIGGPETPHEALALANRLL
jgi:hypothetical protein